MLKRAGYVGLSPLFAYGFLIFLLGIFTFLIIFFPALDHTFVTVFGAILFGYAILVSIYFAFIVTGAIDVLLEVFRNLLDGDDDNDEECIPPLLKLSERKDGFGEIAGDLIRYIKSSIEKKHWYLSILDSIPLPISVTDMDMKWTLVNKAVENVLQCKRQDMLGKPCASWDAEICGTRDCGIARLRQGQLRTLFSQQGLNFQVDSSYLFDTTGAKVGHVEVVQDVTSMMSILEYQKTAVEALSNDLAQLANGVYDFEAAVLESGSSYTQDVRRDLLKIQENIEKTRTTTHATLSRVLTDANQVLAASDQLAQASKQAGYATDQISSTIQEVARGFSETSQSISKVVQIIQSMNEDLSAMSVGIENQTKAIQRASNVSDKIAGSDGISTKVGVSAEKVKSLVEQSEKIELIIDTIADFASQTNLLAINAAIETAHAETQSFKLKDMLLNNQMVSQTRLLNQILAMKGFEFTPAFWADVARRAKIDTICITDKEGAIVYSNDSSLLGWKFPDDPKAQAYVFRQLINQKDGVVCQEPQKRSVDNRTFKFVGISRTDEPGIVQVAFDSDTLAEFDVRMGGFAVVAEEVRKLANKSAEATKEIGSIVKEMGKRITESVLLTDKVSHEINTASGELIQAIEVVSGVVGDNLKSTNHLVSSSREIMSMMESVAAVSEENSASAEEVSASTEEMTAQVDAVDTSAQSLQAMAGELQKAIGKFRL